MATLQLPALGAAITVCAREHAVFIGVKFEGSFAQCKSSSFQGPLPLASAKKHHTLLMEIDEKVAYHFPAFRAKLNVLDTPDVDALTTRSTQRAQKVGNAWKSLSLSFTNGEGGDYTRSPSLRAELTVLIQEQAVSGCVKVESGFR